MITDQIRIHAQNHPSKTALVLDGKAISYAQLERLTGAFEESLHGIQESTVLFRGDALENLCGMLACNQVGKSGIVLPLDFSEERIRTLRQEYQAVLWGKETSGGQGLDDSKTKEEHNDNFLGILTSGSTGEPKVIWKSDANWQKAFPYQSEIFGLTSEDRIFVVDALAYSANLNAVIHGLWLGATVVLGQFSQSRFWLKQWEQQQISAAFLVPSHCRLLTKSQFKYTGLKSLATAGEKLDVNTARFLLEKFPNVCLTEYYGAAELGHITYHQNWDIVHNPISVGKPFPEVQIAISEGEIQVHSPYVSEDFKERATVHDLGYFEGEHLILLGRAGRVFNRRGINIFAQEVENVALDCGLIQEAVLVSHSDSLEIQKLTLFYSPKKEGNISELELRKRMAEKLPKSKLPNFFKELKVIPHSDAGKIDFRALSKMCDEHHTKTATDSFVHFSF
ncbi:AMP-binding protein [Marinilongibacter aquaticus]|uniref:AMP-binding protein n=1 Tax=Marinilongibacter aquaticus TaxID=2975157 RepID=UPI0021BD317F|nr:AMP-binding protein [Marinilongibacter aquaticus]UBM58428.1 AMP-binding protein [Marinilongibacter aquaticus]